MGLVMVRRMRIKWQPEFGQERKGNAGKVWVPVHVLSSSSLTTNPCQQVGLGENINVLGLLASLCALQIPSPPLSSPSLSLLLLLRGK